jgi:hypothetical protein
VWRLAPLALAVIGAIATARAAIAEPSPNPSCPFAPEDSQEFAALDRMAPQIVAELARRIPAPENDRTAPIMAARDGAWQATDSVVPGPLQFRRFIRGGRVGTRWYVWYERGGISHSYNLALFDLPPAAPAAHLVIHLAVVLDDLCPVTRALLQLRDAEGGGLDGGDW